MSRALLQVVIWVAMLIPAAAPADDKIQILALVDDSQPLGFLYQTRGRQVTSNIIYVFGGIVPWMIDDKLTKSTLQENSVKFRQTVGTFDRRPILENSLVGATKALASYFRIATATSEQYTRYLQHGKPNFGAMKADGWKYVLVVSDRFTGMASSQFGSVSTYSNVEYAVYEIASEKQMNRGLVMQAMPGSHSYERAIGDRKIFVTEYPQVAVMLGTGIIGSMTKNDVFYTIGRAEGIGNKVFPVSKILADYARNFDYAFDLPHGWKKQNYDMKYRMNIGPKVDWQVFGNGFSVDLLVDALGNNVKTLPEYRRIFLSRLAITGYPVETARPFDGLDLDKSWEVFIIHRPDRVGREIVAMKMIGDVVFIHDFVFIRDYETFFAKYRADIEHLVNKGRYSSKGS